MWVSVCLFLSDVCFWSCLSHSLFLPFMSCLYGCLHQSCPPPPPPPVSFSLIDIGCYFILSYLGFFVFMSPSVSLILIFGSSSVCLFVSLCQPVSVICLCYFLSLILSQSVLVHLCSQSVCMSVFLSLSVFLYLTFFMHFWSCSCR